LTSQPSSVLLDKGIVRRLYEFQVRLAKGESPTPLQIEAVKVWLRLAKLAKQTYITQQSANVLKLRPPQYANAILNSTKAMLKGRYHRRWARRLRDYVFTREDAVILAYGSFGVDLATQRLGVDAILTGDLRMATNFNTRYAEIKERFDRLIKDLPEPYHSATLPEIVTPTVVLSEW
jgi:hypothetical protein